MNHFNVFNYHITNRCNYRCVYCFGKFPNQKDPSVNEAKAVINAIHAYLLENNIQDGRINFAGGEPLLYPHLDELIRYAHSLGIAVSLVTNGSLLTIDRIHSWKGLVSCIGISIDSCNAITNQLIGRSCFGKAIDFDHWIGISEAIHKSGIKLKINTVVSKLNLEENLSPLYEVLHPERIKLFQMHLVKGINDKSVAYGISEDIFNCFVDKHNAFQSVLVPEPCHSMENSYLMINPEGFVQLNNNGSYRLYGDCKTSSLTSILNSMPMDESKFHSRYSREVSK